MSCYRVVPLFPYHFDDRNIAVFGSYSKFCILIVLIDCNFMIVILISKVW